MYSIDNGGVALVKVMVLTGILLAVSAYAARTTRVELMIANNDGLHKRALAIAEAGLQHAWRKVGIDLNGGVTITAELAAPTGFLATGTTQTFDGVSYRFVSFGGSSTDGYWVRLDNNSDDVGGPTSDTDGRIIITSRGGLARSERIVQAILRQLPLFGDGLFGKYGADLRGGGYTDSYDSGAGPYGGQTPGSDGNVGSNGSITNNGSPTTINGSESAGGTIAQGQATITGGYYEGQPQVALPPVTPPCGSPTTNGNGITPVNTYNSGNGQLRGNASDNVILSGGVYCFSSVTLNGNATLTIPNGVSVEIYLLGSGDSNFTGGGIINQNEVPASLRIFATASVGDITVNGGA
ncbi:MAG TPA: hypothetical protein VLD86_05870, partial [Ilumatobacteraceae bacterium]|nr:hypothetical protein [Ilumatobacteraceae bacterium]